MSPKMKWIITTLMLAAMLVPLLGGTASARPVFRMRINGLTTPIWCHPGLQAFTHTGAPVVFTAPERCTEIDATVFGAGSGIVGTIGNAGEQKHVVLAAEIGETFKIRVGQGGGIDYEQTLEGGYLGWFGDAGTASGVYAHDGTALIVAGGGDETARTLDRNGGTWQGANGWVVLRWGEPLPDLPEAPAAVAIGAPAGCEPGVRTFDYTDGNHQTFTVPVGCEFIDVVVMGGDSGSANNVAANKGRQVSKRVAVTPGETLSVRVGQGGRLIYKRPQGETFVGWLGTAGEASTVLSGQDEVLASAAGGAPTDPVVDKPTSAWAGASGQVVLQWGPNPPAPTAAPTKIAMKVPVGCTSGIRVLAYNNGEAETFSVPGACDKVLVDAYAGASGYVDGLSPNDGGHQSQRLTDVEGATFTVSVGQGGGVNYDQSASEGYLGWRGQAGGDTTVSRAGTSIVAASGGAQTNYITTTPDNAWRGADGVVVFRWGPNPPALPAPPVAQAIAVPQGCESGMRAFDASDTFTVPAQCGYVLATVYGGDSGSAQEIPANVGQHVSQRLTVTPGGTLGIDIGRGGRVVGHWDNAAAGFLYHGEAGTDSAVTQGASTLLSAAGAPATAEVNRGPDRADKPISPMRGASGWVALQWGPTPPAVPTPPMAVAQTNLAPTEPTCTPGSKVFHYGASGPDGQLRVPAGCYAVVATLYGADSGSASNIGANIGEHLSETFAVKPTETLMVTLAGGGSVVYNDGWYGTAADDSTTIYKTDLSNNVRLLAQADGGAQTGTTHDKPSAAYKGADAWAVLRWGSPLPSLPSAPTRVAQNVPIPPCEPGIKTFSAVGNNSFTVPWGCNTVNATVYGGDSGSASNVAANVGQHQAQDVPVTPGSTLGVVVGGGGAPAFDHGWYGKAGGSSRITSGATTLVNANGGGQTGKTQAKPISAYRGAHGIVVLRWGHPLPGMPGMPTRVAMAVPGALCYPGSQVFTTPGSHSFRIPLGCDSAVMTAYGGDSGSANNVSVNAGKHQTITRNGDVMPGETINVVVGFGGSLVFDHGWYGTAGGESRIERASDHTYFLRSSGGVATAKTQTRPGTGYRGADGWVVVRWGDPLPGMPGAPTRVAMTVPGAVCYPGSQTFNYTGSTKNFTVPLGCTSVAARVYGGDSGSANNFATNYGQRKDETLSVSPGQTLKITAGRGGSVAFDHGWYAQAGTPSTIVRGSTTLASAAGGNATGKTQSEPTSAYRGAHGIVVLRWGSPLPGMPGMPGRVAMSVPEAVCYPGSQTFNYTGSDQYFTMPLGCSTLDIVAAGAGGGAGWHGEYGNIRGGSGIMINASVEVSPKESLRIIVGAGGPTQDTSFSTAGGGGGLAGIFDSSNDPIVIAGAGGGAGITQGGDAGLLFGEDAPDYSEYLTGGKGGTQVSGGNGGYNISMGPPKGQVAQSGSFLNGGDSYQVFPSSFPYSPQLYGGGGRTAYTGGGGGAGYFGGGGGTVNNGGGGGSSYIANDVTVLRTSGANNGGLNRGPGADASVVLTWSE